MISTPDLASPRFKANPFPFYAGLRALSPVAHVTYCDGKPAWLLSRHADVAAALKDPRLGKDPYRVLSREERAAQVPWMPWFLRPLTQNMLDQDPPSHTRLRGLVQQAFTPQRIEDLRPRVEARCAELLAAARRRGAMDVVEDFALPVPLWVICELLGVPEADRRRFRAWTSRLTAIVGTRDMVLALPHLWALMRYVRSLAKQRRGAHGDDLITALLGAEEAGARLSEDELLAMIFLLLVAGHETTVNLIANGTLALLDHPEALERLRAEPALIKPAVEELLRFTSPVDTATERYTTEEYAVSGHVIPRGQRVLALLASANHDERVFAEPEQLKLDREPNRHLALGVGIHYCLGAPLARLEAQAAFSALVRELPDLRLAAPREAVRWKRSTILRSLEALPVEIPRASSGASRAARAAGSAAQPAPPAL
ncbi:cytochrome P450 [Sorangium cellulosum]|uniref:Cytochrome P450 n=1 Tax=Sorangium cellulosum TaxID=56 RepID=A0A4P2Q378_SORCE|nr:cytochrome P450 [Sorangium cellulosum]AUX23775.1 cytochrome P450 [Sorangium cellulosum]